MLLCAPRTSRPWCSRPNAIMNGAHARPAGQAAARASRRVRPSPRSRSPSPTASGTRPASRWSRQGLGRQLHARRHEDVRDRRSHREPHRGGARGSRARAARTASGFFAVDADAAGLTRTPLATMDQTRKQAKLEFAGVAATPLGDAGNAAGRRCREDARPGGGDVCQRDGRRRAEGARHVGRVRQGPRAVRSADRLVPGDQAQVRRHAPRGRVGRSRPPTTPRGPRPRTTRSSRSSASLAKAYCSDAYFHAAAENIQIHGGIGFTWEHDAHLYFKRAKSSEILLGDATYHRELLAQRIGI